MTGEKKEALVLSIFYLSKLVTSHLNIKTDEVTIPHAHRTAVSALSVGELCSRVSKDISSFAALTNFDTTESQVQGYGTDMRL